MKDSVSTSLSGGTGRPPAARTTVTGEDGTLEVVLREEGHVTVAVAAGTIDALTAETLQSTLEATIRDGRVHLVMDLASVEYTSSAGLGTLLLLVKEARRFGGDCRLAGVRPRVNRVLEMTGFTSFMKLYPDAALAVASFGAAQ